jgi:outer membrane immunogenic protein
MRGGYGWLGFCRVQLCGGLTAGSLAVLAAVATIGPVHAQPAGVTSSGSARSAGMAIRAESVAAPPNWTGFYAGVHAGWGWTNATGTASSGDAPARGGPVFLPRSYDLGDNGPLLGLHLGYNWQSAPNWLIGVEGDWTGAGLRGFQSGAVTLQPGIQSGDTGGTSHMQRDVKWLASVRGRLGYTWATNMIYATGGVAWSRVDLSGDAAPAAFGGNGSSFAGSGSKTQTGWVIGGGYETMLSANWLLRAEYLYYAFDGTTITGPCSPTTFCAGQVISNSKATYAFGDLDIHTVRLGLSYKLGQGPGGVPARAPLAAASWAGLYVGAHAGWGWTSNDRATASSFSPAGPVFIARSYDVSDNGPLFGLHLGYNWQLAPAWVVGVEGDWTGSGLRGFESGPLASDPANPIASGSSHMQRDVKWLASVRGRLGYAWANNMIYATGGAAWVGYDVSGDANPISGTGSCCSFSASGSSTQTGWTVGGGYEAMILPNWTLRAEYLYYAFGGIAINATCTAIVNGLAPGCNGVPGSIATYAFGDLNIHTTRLGVSYKF